MTDLVRKTTEEYIHEVSPYNRARYKSRGRKWPFDSAVDRVNVWSNASLAIDAMNRAEPSRIEPIRYESQDYFQPGKLNSVRRSTKLLRGFLCTKWNRRRNLRPPICRYILIDRLSTDTDLCRRLSSLPRVYGQSSPRYITGPPFFRFTNLSAHERRTTFRTTFADLAERRSKTAQARQNFR